ncbi:MAG: DUF4339 domain-containing protein [Planctomycetota bacterium]
MSGGEDPIFEEGLPGGGAPGAAGDAADDRMAAGPWFVRFAGRRSGPFDADRLRTMARRGALTRMHSLSADGSAWAPASSVRAVFNADGSVVAAGVRAVELEPVEEQALGEGDGEVLEMPRSTSRRAMGNALVRPVVLTALVLATVMLAMPTSRDDSRALAWWWSEGALGMAVRGLCSVAVLGGWAIAFLAPEPARAASVAAVAAVLSTACALVAVPAIPWAAPIALLVPMAALLVALDAAGSNGARAAGIAAAVVSGLGAVGTIVLGVMGLSGWSIAGMALGTLGAGALAYGGVRASRPTKGAAGGDAVFWSGVAGATGAMASVFAAAFGGLLGNAPMQGALVAVGACLVLSFAALSWAAVHEACETSHLLPSMDDGDGTMT